MWQIFLFLLCNCNTVHADILKCERPNATLYYTDRGCASLDQETIVPCEPKTLSPKEIKHLEKQLAKSRHTIHKKAIQRERQKLVDYKLQQRDRKRRLQLKAKCEKLLRQIDDLNQKYKDGYTVKQGIALDRKLSKYNEMRQKVCNE